MGTVARESRGCRWKHHLLALIKKILCSRSILALETFPGPTIRANKVGLTAVIPTLFF